MSGDVVEREMRPSVADRRGATDSLVKLGMGSELSFDDLTARMKSTHDVLKALLPPDLFEQVMGQLDTVWK
ncbi:MAG TPA: hypothetical protein VGD56_08105, partial [Gemmatirosa sp.]